MIQVDRHTVIQILGSLMAQPSLLNDTDKYLLEKDDFPQTMDKYIFSAIYNLYTQGAEAIRTVDIVNYLDTNSKAKNLIEKENGISFLQDCENECEPKNFSYYYNNLKKLNLLKDLQRTGKDVSNIYCEDVLSPDYNKINDKFETMTPNDIINLLKKTISKYSVYVTLFSLIISQFHQINKVIIVLKYNFHSNYICNSLLFPIIAVHIDPHHIFISQHF